MSDRPPAFALLARMLTDRNPATYTYAEAVRVLRHLDEFNLAPHGGGSHRKWRGISPSGTVVVVGLVDKGSGALKPYLIREMLQQLRENALLPPNLE